jgi:hypothetical protein
MNKIKFTVLACIILSVLYYSCKKDDTNRHYIRGGINNTGVNYNIIKLTFNANGTGTYTAEDGTTYNTTWEFTSTDEHNMLFVVNGSETFVWNMVEISETSFQSTTALDKLGILQSTRYTPIP